MRKVRGLSKQPFPAPDVVTKVVPAPTDGWDAISPLAKMDPTRAPILTNWVPRPGWVEFRAGFAPYAVVGNGLPVESIFVRRASGAQQIFCASGGSIYAISNPVSPQAVVTGRLSARCQYVNFTPPAGTTVIQIVNGRDPLLQYDGTSWTNPTITGLPGSATTNNITNIFAQKNRLWYMLGTGSQVAFMPTGAIQGPVAGTQDFGSILTKGGTIVAMADWTIDGGNGPSDYAAFFSSEGQVVLYSGTDPTNANAWSLIGVFNVSPLVGGGLRSTVQLGSDVGIITYQGLLPLSQVLPFDPSADRSAALTSRIQNAMAQATSSAAANFGWQFITFPAQQFGILNVPLITNQSQVQFVMNTITGAWCKFQGWNANVFELWNQQLYFGDNSGNVNLAYSTALDGAAAIQADMQCAFNYFDDPGRTKRMTMVQPLLTASGQVTPFISVDADFQTSTAVAPIIIVQGGAEWDVAIWDQSQWPGETVAITNWLSVEVLGHALAVRMRVNLSSTNSTTVGEFDLGVFDSAEFDAGIGSQLTLQVNAFNAVMELGGYI